MSEAKSDAPLFIIGNPRSGTSLLRLILTSHSRILVPPECGFIIWLRQKYQDWKVSDNNDPSRIKAFLVDLFACKKFDTWALDGKHVEAKIIDSQPKSYSELCSVVYATFGSSIGKDFSVWGDKNNFHIHHLDELRELYEKARFLHIVRDGRDVVCSYREVMAGKSKSPYAPKFDINISDVALDWSKNVMKVDAFMTLMSSDMAMTIKYEDLVLNPISCIKSICEWLNVIFEIDMLNFYQKNIVNKLEPIMTLDWKKRTLQPINNDRVGRYKNMLSYEEQIVFSSIASNALHYYSYI